MVKAVDPGKYPFYGKIELDPPGPLSGALTGDTLIASPDLLFRLGIEIGDEVRLGDETFRVAAVVRVEPDRMTGSFNVGPRVMLSREASRPQWPHSPRQPCAPSAICSKLPPEGISIEMARKELRAVFEGAYITDFRGNTPDDRRGLDRATNFLSLVRPRCSHRGRARRCDGNVFPSATEARHDCDLQVHRSAFFAGHTHFHGADDRSGVGGEFGRGSVRVAHPGRVSIVPARLHTGSGRAGMAAGLWLSRPWRSEC